MLKNTGLMSDGLMSDIHEIYALYYTVFKVQTLNNYFIERTENWNNSWVLRKWKEKTKNCERKEKISKLKKSQCLKIFYMPCH